MVETQGRFNALSEEFVEVGFRYDPVAATSAGIHDYDHLLPNDSPDGFRERTAWLRDFERRLAASVPPERLAAEQRVDLELLRTRLAALRCGLEQIRVQARDPVRYPDTALLGVFLLLARPFAPLEERKEAILSRLMAIPDYLEAARANLEHPAEVAIDTASEVALGGLAFVDDVTRSLLRSFPGEAERIEHGGGRARMGFLQYQGFLERELRGRAAPGFAIGREAMDFKLRNEHLLQMDCDALEQFGCEQVEQTRRLLEEEAKRLDPSRSWREQVAAAKRRHPEAARLRDAYVAEVDRARRFVEEKRLAPIPDGRLEIIDTPIFDRATIPYAAYLPAAPFDWDHTAYFFVTPVDGSRPADEQAQRLEGHPTDGMPLIVVHEAYPGHHVQLLHANRAGSRLRRLADSDVLAEGWALYCEELMHEQGYYSPATRLLQLKDLMWRACRVVLDVRLHTGRVSFDQAVEFLVEEAMLDRASAVAEVRRYVLTPTEPMSYLVGKKLILEMRDEAMRRMGSRFSLYDFHAALLASGSLPPALVREELRERIGVE